MTESENLPKVSVVVPIYNVENYIKNCLQSLQVQSFDNFEVILVDDGSTDQSSKIAKSFADKYSKFKYFRKENGGLSSARNFGIDRARGSYICFIDSDDYIDSNYLYCLYRSIIKYNSSVAMCGCLEKFSGKEKIILPNEKSSIITGKKLLSNVFNKRNGMIYTIICNKMFESKLFISHKFTEGKLYEDELINPELYWDVSSISVVERPLYKYVIRDTSIIGSKINREKIQDAKDAFQKRSSFYKDRDKNLYILANNYCCSWAINTIYENQKYFLRHNKDLELLHKFYEKYSKIGHVDSLKCFIKLLILKIKHLY